MIETTVQDPELLETVRADSQGRVNLGVAFANREVELLVVSSEPSPPAEAGIQHTIEDGPVPDFERKGVLFARTFGVAREHLQEDHTADIEDGTVVPETVNAADLNWSDGRLVDARNVARFTFDEAADAELGFVDELRAEPASISQDEDTFETPAYRFENENGEASAIAREYVDKVSDVYGYDPVAEPSQVRVHPDEAPMPVLFRDPDGDTYIVLAPMVQS